MSYRERQTKKGRKPKTPKQLRRIYTRDLQFCERWGIGLDDAWRWDRHPLRNYQP